MKVNRNLDIKPEKLLANIITQEANKLKVILLGGTSIYNAEQ